VVGEVHNPRHLGPSETPHWLEIPERGLFTGIAILGAVGSGKSSSCMYPYAEQILAYKAHDPEQRIGGIILEVKGDFCRKVKQILNRHGRGDDYIEISLDSEYRYNPLHNDLDAYALAFNIASLLNNRRAVQRRYGGDGHLARTSIAGFYELQIQRGLPRTRDTGVGRRLSSS
jgi:hypothetical protein